MFLIEKKVVPMLGIDISASAVKLLEIKAGRNRLSVESYAVVPMPAGAIVDKTIASVDAVGESIKQAVAKSRTKNKLAAVAVSGTSVITKVIPMSAGFTELELEEQIQVEASQHIPFSIEDVVMDFEVLGESPDDPEQVDVMLAASRSEIVDNFVAAIDVAGLEAKVVDVESFAADNALALMVQESMPDIQDGVVAVADIGSLATSFSVMQSLVTIHSREQPFGGLQLTEEIQKRYGLSFEEAGNAKKQGGLPDNYGPEVLEPFKETMVQQVGRAQQFFFSSCAVESIDHLVLAGGCATIPGVAALMEEKLGVPTSIADPFSNMSIASKVSADKLAKDAPAMLVATGLSLRGVTS